jgi:hypothetical protein
MQDLIWRDFMLSLLVGLYKAVDRDIKQEAFQYALMEVPDSKDDAADVVMTKDSIRRMIKELAEQMGVQ